MSSRQTLRACHIPIAFVCATIEAWVETRKIVKAAGFIVGIRTLNLPIMKQMFYFTLQHLVYCPEFGADSGV
jgi:hypothetical protein